MNILKILSHFSQIIPLFFFLVLVKPFPFSIKVKIGSLFFKILIISIPKLKKRIKDNISIAFPNMNKKKQKEFIRNFSLNAGKTFTELLHNEEYQKKISLFNYNKNDLLPIFQAKKEGKPIIIVSGHFGPWESIRAVLKINNLETAAIYKKNSNIFYEKIHLNCIKKGGEPIFPVGLDGTRKMLKYLKNGGIVAVMIDQAVGNGVKFPFFGKPAKTSTSIAKIAINLNALIIPAFALRKKNDSVDIIFQPPIKISNVDDMTIELNYRLEMVIRESPVHWYWIHKRWKD